MRSVIVFISQAILVASLLVIPRLGPRKFDNQLSNYFYSGLLNYELYILAGLAVLNLFLNTFPKLFVEPRKKRAKIRSAILGAMSQELFGGEDRDLRITIFTRPNPFQFSFIWIRVLWSEIARRIRGKKGDNRLRLRKLTRYRFVRPLQRLGTQYPAARTHFFYNLDDGEHCEGVVGQVMQERVVTMKRELIPPTEVDLKGVYQEEHASTLVKRYMKETNSNLRTLRRLNIKAKHFYGQPIVNKENSAILGVLIVDSTQASSPFEKRNLPSRIAEYAKMLYETL